jgi:polyphosphate kinase
MAKTKAAQTRDRHEPAATARSKTAQAREPQPAATARPRAAQAREPQPAATARSRAAQAREAQPAAATKSKAAQAKEPPAAKAKSKAATPKSKAAKARDRRELAGVWADPPSEEAGATTRTIKNKDYLRELARLQVELVKLQEWIRQEGLRVVLAFEGRDAAGKGGAIKTITLSLNPRFARVVALGTPTEREKTQWYFQRYVPHLPAAGEMVLFDRSWYNRAGVERVMGFCTDEEYAEFLRSCPEFERMLIRSGIILVKYWFSVSDAEQERRFRGRIEDPTKRWKLSPMDLQSRGRWVEYSRAKDEMFKFTDTKQSPWWVVNGDNKKRARLNVISHLLSKISYKDLTPEPIALPPREPDGGYVRPPMAEQSFIPEPY